MDSLFSILGSKDFSEPPESQSIKKFVRDAFNTEVSVMVRDKDIIVGVPNASLAGTLRMRVPEIQRRCQIKKRLVFRIEK